MGKQFNALVDAIRAVLQGRLRADDPELVELMMSDEFREADCEIVSHEDRPIGIMIPIRRAEPRRRTS